MKEILQTISNNILSLEPITPEHKEALRKYAAFDNIWTNTTLMNKYLPELFDTWFSLAFNNTKSGLHKCFIINYQGKYIGSSRYYGINPNEKSIAIGFTWISPEFWGTKVNPSIKFLMLNNAFENGFEKVYFHTDIRNKHSQAAISKLGAKHVQTNEKDKLRLDGTLRDTVEYVLDLNQWQETQKELLSRISS